MHVQTNVNQESASGLVKTTKQVQEKMRDMLHIPYHHVLAKIKKPHWNQLVDSIFISGILNIIILSMTFVGLYRLALIHWFPKRAQRLIDALSPPAQLSKWKRKQQAKQCLRIALTTSAPFKGFQSFLFDSDGLTFVVDNAANCHVCKDKSLFVGSV